MCYVVTAMLARDECRIFADTIASIDMAIVAVAIFVENVIFEHSDAINEWTRKRTVKILRNSMSNVF